MNYNGTYTCNARTCQESPNATHVEIILKMLKVEIMIQAQHVSKQGEMTPTYCTKYLDHEQSTEIGDKTHSAKTIKDLMK